MLILSISNSVNLSNVIPDIPSDMHKFIRAGSMIEAEGSEDKFNKILKGLVNIGETNPEYYDILTNGTADNVFDYLQKIGGYEYSKNVFSIAYINEMPTTK